MFAFRDFNDDTIQDYHTWVASCCVGEEEGNAWLKVNNWLRETCQSAQGNLFTHGPLDASAYCYFESLSFPIHLWKSFPMDSLVFFLPANWLPILLWSCGEQVFSRMERLILSWCRSSLLLIYRAKISELWPSVEKLVHITWLVHISASMTVITTF